VGSPFDDLVIVDEPFASVETGAFPVGSSLPSLRVRWDAPTVGGLEQGDAVSIPSRGDFQVNEVQREADGAIATITLAEPGTFA
ncbi:MAG: hypothetical protein AAF517_10305, partial [Planctomycetota bacterium]